MAELSEPIQLRARGKVNLHLRVLAVRPDGFHEIETVMQSVDFFDDISMVPSSTVSVEKRWADGIDAPLPRQPGMVEKATRLFLQRGGVTEGVSASVVKRIPLGSGLGGGSADAAAALIGLSEMFGPLVPLVDLGAALGSDVPFLIKGGTALASGRGEIVTPIRCFAAFWWVLGLSDIHMHTPEVYARFDELRSEVADPPSSAAIIGAIVAGDVRMVAECLHNDLEPAAFAIAPALAEKKEAMQRAGALGAVMTGSGSAITGLCRDREQAEEVARKVAPHFDRVEVVLNTRLGAQKLQH